ncbi:hypothetical protein GCM10020221_32570 [Streptomyces thioluteus]|uniref:Secreted protein n=1 Tax=Streptomyces thioluteus TaxID=66431 RepID=A0ABN3X387_STRTU
MHDCIFRWFGWLRKTLGLALEIPPATTLRPTTPTPTASRHVPEQAPQRRCGCEQLAPIQTSDEYVLVPSVHGLNIVRRPQVDEVER